MFYKPHAVQDNEPEGEASEAQVIVTTGRRRRLTVSIDFDDTMKEFELWNYIYDTVLGKFDLDAIPDYENRIQHYEITSDTLSLRKLRLWLKENGYNYKINKNKHNFGGFMSEAYFTPFNRHLVVDLIEEEKNEEESLVVLPTDYKKPESPYAKAIVIEIAADSKFNDNIKLEHNDTVLVERRMLNKVEINNYSFYLILENYVYGRISNEIE